LPFWNIASVPVDPRDAALVLGALAYGIGVNLKNAFIATTRSTPQSRLLNRSLLLAAWAMVSAQWSAIERIDITDMSVTVAFFAGSVILAYGTVRPIRPRHLRGFVRWTVMAFTAVCGLYSADSIFSLGLHGREFSVLQEGYAIGRVAGPLFAASTGYFLIIPAMGFMTQELVNGAPGRTMAIVSLTIQVITLFALGSRGAMLVLAAFLALVLFFIRNARSVILTCALALILAVASLTILSTFGEVSRIGSMEDTKRTSLYESALDLISSRPILTSLIGSGYGSVWPWYRVDEYMFQKQPGLSVATQYGSLAGGDRLYTPHSVLIMACVELGVMGGLYVVYLWLVLGRAFWYAAPANKIWAASMAASGIALLFDLFLFYRARECVLWWVWLFALLIIAGAPEARPLISDRVHAQKTHRPQQVGAYSGAM
jgi:O-antigen ligase